MTAARTQPPFPGFLLVAGGQTRKVGKSSLVVDIIDAFPNRNWTAVKITPYAESGCPVNGASCGCAPEAHPFAIREEFSRTAATDSSRFLAAGAHRSLWVQTKDRRLQDALPALAAEIGSATHIIIESDALVRFWKPSVFVMVLDPTNTDFKSSARENMDEADAFVFRSPYAQFGAVADSPRFNKAEKFLQEIGSPLPEGLKHFLSGSLSAESPISHLDTKDGISS
jgi:hypothetical protein